MTLDTPAKRIFGILIAILGVGAAVALVGQIEMWIWGGVWPRFTSSLVIGMWIAEKAKRIAGVS
jgi:hypothetical protein